MSFHTAKGLERDQWLDLRIRKTWQQSLTRSHSRLGNLAIGAFMVLGGKLIDHAERAMKRYAAYWRREIIAFEPLLTLL